MSKITRLEAQNVMRLTAVRITPDGSLVVVGGNNAQGKTSVLNSIAMAIGGKRLCPEQPLRKGAKKGHATVTLDDGLIITRTFTKSGGGSLVVSDKNGAVKSPQAMLDKLTGALAFDPLEFSRQKPLDQLLTLKQLSGIDTAAADDEEAEARSRRADANREIKRLEAALELLPAKHPDVEPVNVGALVEQIEAAETQRRGLERGRGFVKSLGEDLESLKLRRAELEQDLKMLNESIPRKEKEIVSATAEMKNAEQQLPDVAALKATLAGAEATNQRARENRTRSEQEALLEQAKGVAFKADSDLQLAMERREQAVAAAKLPIKGLGLGEDGVTFQGVPFAQASAAEQLRVSVAMGLAMNPELKVLLIRDGSLLDAESLAMVAKMAEDGDAQIWMERVGDGDEVSVVIEDGTVREGAKQAEVEAGEDQLQVAP